MKKFISAIILSSFALSGAAFAQTSTSTATTTAFVNLGDEISAINKALEEQVKILQQELEAKIKALRNEYKKKVEALSQAA